MTVNKCAEAAEFLKVVDSVVSHAEDKDSLRTSLRAALRLYESKGYRRGYDDAMGDARHGRDRRVVAHLN